MPDIESQRDAVEEVTAGTICAIEASAAGRGIGIVPDGHAGEDICAEDAE
jgi:hypothetical protein